MIAAISQPVVNYPILYEDDAIVVVDKPPGIVVNRATTVKGDTIQDFMARRYPQIFSAKPEEEAQTYRNKDEDNAEEQTVKEGYPDTFYTRWGVVHRIDKETSGVLLLAKTAGAFSNLQSQFFAHTVQKTYLAIVHGKVLQTEGEINAPIGRLPWNRERFGVVLGGKESFTKFTVLAVFLNQKNPKEQLSLLRVFPKTGRTHQIRVHLQYLSYPLLGDYLYGGRKRSRDDRLWVSRVMLHAHTLACLHPTTGAPLSVSAPVADDMQQVLRSCGVGVPV